jgi:hypothetical protein
VPHDDASRIRPGAADGLAFVEAELNYLRPMAEKPYTLAYYTEPGDLPTNAVYDAHLMPIRDARPIAAEASLDVEGFTLATRPSAVTDWYDEGQLDGLCHEEAARLVADITGASRVEVFDHTLRIRRDDVADRTPGTARLPVMRVHNDYTEISGPQRVRDLMPDEAEALLEKRFAFINVWRPIKGPVLDTPLAVCDARSVAPDDFVASDMVYKDRKGEIFVNTFSPAHRWFYVSKMTTDEALLIKCYDSRRDVARFTAHSAFTDPTTPADAPARASIEIRTVAFFD